MSQLIDDVTYLSREIGARPAGTEEEQQAALYLAETLQEDAGFQVILEDFSGIVNPDLPKAICFGTVFVCALVSILVPLLTLPAALISLIAAVLYMLEAVDKPVLSRFLKGGVSQNVVAKYQPAGVPKKRRKIILVANYDSGRVVPDQKGFLQANRRYFEIAYLVGLVFVPVVLLLQGVVFPSASGGVDGFFTFLTVVGMILVAVPVAFSILHLRAQYTEAANNNASGAAVLLDVARKVGNGCVSLDEMERMAKEQGSEIEGEDAAYEAGVVPDGAELDYVASREKEMSPSDSLAAAHAAIAALTGKPVTGSTAYTAVSHHRDEMTPKEIFAYDGQDTSEESQAIVDAEANFMAQEENLPSAVQSISTREVEPEVTDGPVTDESAVVKEEVEPAVPIKPMYSAPVTTVASGSIPSWARAAQAKARENKPEQMLNVNASRSRYADTPAAQISGQSHPARGFVEQGVSVLVAASKVEVANIEAKNASEMESRVSSTQASMIDPEPVADEPLSSDPVLAARLAALRGEIKAAPVPHLSDEARKAFDEMDKPAPKPVVSRETTEPVVEEPADEQPVVVADEQLEGWNEGSVEAVDAIIDEQLEESVPEQIEEAAEDSSVEEEAPRSTARSLRHSSEGHSFGGFMSKIQKAAESAAAVASEAGAQLGEKVQAARTIESKQEFVEEDLLIDEQPMDDVVDTYDSQQEVCTSDEPDVVEAMDVSAFMNRPLPVNEVSNANEETTQPVSMAQIREAMATASSGIVAPEASEESEPIIMEDQDQQSQVSPIVGLDLDSLPTFDSNDSKDSEQVITLPEISAGEVNQVEAGAQRAPMAEVGKRSALVSGAIPRISMDELSVDETKADRFGLNLPPLGAEPEVSHEVVSATSSFSTVGGTGAFAPVGDELVEGIPEENRYVDDADDSSFEEDHTETGAFAGHGYVDMPQSRVGRLFGRFGRKKKQQDEGSMREWMGAEDDYTAQSAGADRGSWESFREEDGKGNSGSWNGGAFSLDSLRKIDVKSLGSKFAKRGTQLHEDYADEAYEVEQPYESEYDYGDDVLAAQGDAHEVDYSSADYEVAGEPVSRVRNESLSHVNEFRHPGIDTEVWFVGLGSEIGSNSGMRAFLENHADELEGAVIVSIQAVGAGKLSYVDTEGVLFPVKPSSRMKRFMRQAAERSGVSYATNKLLSVETPASCAMRRGHQAFSIVGVQDGKPTHYAEAVDTIENIDPAKLEEASSFVMELLKSI